jgi:hypothetical protein
VGVAVAGIVLVGIAVGATMPLTRPWFEDRRMAEVDTAGELAHQALVRIPLGPPSWRSSHSGVCCSGCSSGWAGRRRPSPCRPYCFGPWHIRPTLGALATNDLVDGAGPRRVRSRPQLRSRRRRTPVLRSAAGVGEPCRSADRAHGYQQRRDRRRLRCAARRMRHRRPPVVRHHPQQSTINVE